MSKARKRLADDVGVGEELGDLDRGVLGAVGAVHSPTETANSLRMVPASALAGLVAPITSRYLATALSPSRT